MRAPLEEVIATIKQMDANELEQLLDIAQKRYEEVSSPANPVLEGDIPESAGGAPVEALEDADMDYDREMAGVMAGPPEMEEEEDDEYPAPSR